VIRILDRMVGGTFLQRFLLFVLGAPLLFVLGDLTDRLDTYLGRGLTAWDMARGYVFMYPKFILWSFPIAALIASVFTVHGMTVNREVVATKAGGISFHRLVTPIFVLGALLTGVALWMTETVPETNRISAELFNERDARRSWRNDFVFQTEDGRSLTVRRLRVPEQRMNGIVMASGDPTDDEPMIHVVAGSARFLEDQGWVFVDGYLRRLLPDGNEATWHFDRLVTRGLDERPEDLLEEPRDEELMTYGEMGDLVEIIRRSGGDPNQIMVEREQKLAIPAATLVIILFGAPLATTSKRGGAAFGVGAALGSTILYLILFRVFGAMGENGALPPLLAAWAPNLLFLVAGLILLSRVRT